MGLLPKNLRQAPVFTARRRTLHAEEAVVANDESAPSPPPADLDPVDLAILRELQADGRTSNAQLASRAGVAPSTALARTRALRERGVVRGVHADIDPARVGRPLQVLIAVRLHGHTHAHVDAFRALAPTLPGVVQVFHVAGQDDYLIHVAATSADAVRALILDRITSHPAVRATQTHLVFEHLRGDGLLTPDAPRRVR
ncbi:Lrp/AsnC family transcriptional regulator [Angustibacter sp. Root456]|uniref:Lrp/AsnC family transcriptional regulator n=1 Tax=Angustibacter sp. Root456 TaxID=1736539 RepID=UPI0009E95A39|nr:Lrp/AsnC family transcriptional regulator [Angustibacter sp. Root456]